MMKISILLVTAVLLQGCSWFGIRDHSNDYRQAETTPRIQLPEGYDQTAINDAYPIPNDIAGGELEGEFEVPRADVVSKVNTNNVRAFRSEGRYWIVVNDSPGSVWGRVRRFWEINGIDLAAQNPNQGLIETAWLSRKAEESVTVNKFRLQVAPGMRENAAEIELQHMGFPRDAVPANDQLNWDATNRNDELALSIMKEIAAFLIETEYEAGSVSLLAQNLLGAPKTNLAEDASGEPVLVMRLNFKRAWESVQNGLAGAEIEIEDKNRSEGIYYLKLKDEDAEEDSSGWFSFFGSKDKEGAGIQVTLQLKDLGDTVEVRVQGEATTQAGFSDDLLTRLRNHLL